MTGSHRATTEDELIVNLTPSFIRMGRCIAASTRSFRSMVAIAGAMGFAVSSHASRPRDDLFVHIRNSTGSFIDFCNLPRTHCRVMHDADTLTDAQSTEGRAAEFFQSWMTYGVIRTCAKLIPLRQMATVTQEQDWRGATVYRLELTAVAYARDVNGSPMLAGSSRQSAVLSRFKPHLIGSAMLAWIAVLAYAVQTNPSATDTASKREFMYRQMSVLLSKGGRIVGRIDAPKYNSVWISRNISHDGWTAEMANGYRDVLLANGWKRLEAVGFLFCHSGVLLRMERNPFVQREVGSRHLSMNYDRATVQRCQDSGNRDSDKVQAD